MQEVTLEQMLQAREKRVETQRALLCAFHRPLVCFTMNIAGPVKISPSIERAFRFGLAQLSARLPSPLHQEIKGGTTGYEAFLVVDMPAYEIKAICTAIEEETPIGRLFDMDVLDSDGKKQERTVPRSCLVCGASGRACAAGRLHSVKELQHATHTLIVKHFLETDSTYIADLAAECLLEEVSTTPKPGLVDKRNTGSHTDMDIHTFQRSAQALKPYFARYFEIGYHTAEKPYAEAFIELRKVGREAEQAMYTATNGVNTHKGIVYSFGVLCGALGRLWNGLSPSVEQQALLTEAAAFVKDSAATDLSSSADNSAGLRCYRNHGITGIRGEVAAGFPSVTSYGLPAFETAIKRGLSANDAGCIALLHLIAHVQDTTLYHRGGVDGAVFAAEYARSLLSATDYPTKQALEAMDNEFICRNLSPGGCADLLAITYFLHKLQ